MIEGGTSREFRKTKRWMLAEPESFHQLLQCILKVTIDYAKLQIDAGVQAFQIFDSWAGILAHQQFREFSLPYLKRVVEAIRPTKIPTILFCKGSSFFAKQLAEALPTALSIDWNADLGELRAALPRQLALQGNLDPEILYSPPSVIKREAKRLLSRMHGDPGYIFNLGHGITPDVPVEAVQTLVETVQNHRNG